MKIVAQDLASPSRPTPLPRQISLRPRRWPPTLALRARAATILLVGGLISLAFALGALAQAQGLARLVWRAAENPRFEIAAALQRSRLPRLYLDVEFQDAQRLKADYQSALATGVHVIPNALARPNDAVTATVRLANENLPVQINLPSGLYTSGEWAFEIITQDERGLFGAHHVWLYGATSHRALSQWGLSQSLKREGILAASVQPVQVTLNGDTLGVYGVWAAPDELFAQSRSPSGLVYFDQTLYWQDLRRQRESGPAPTAINLSDCQVATVAALGSVMPNAVDKVAISRLRDLQTGARKPSDVLDVEQMGTLLALTTLWQGRPLGDWTRLMFYLDASTDRLRPAAPANLISASDNNLLNWPSCFDDPLVQAAYSRAVERISRPEYLDRLRTALGDFEQMQLAFSARDGKPELTWDELAVRQKRMARWLEPTQTVLASWILPPTASLMPSSTLSVSLSNLQRVPVEVLGFDVGKSTFLPIDPAWIQAGSDLIVSRSKGSVVLRAAGEGRLHSLQLSVPYTAVFAATRARDETVEMQVVTRVWGLARRQSAPMERVSGE